VVLLHRENSGAAASAGNASETSPEPPPKAQTNCSATKFIRGTLSSVDCSPPPLATLTVVSGAKTLRMNVADTNHLVLIGADKFSCDWKRQKVMLNCHETSGGEGNVVSLDIQQDHFVWISPFCRKPNGWAINMGRRERWNSLLSLIKWHNMSDRRDVYRS
jgi:hypothetical protein